MTKECDESEVSVTDTETESETGGDNEMQE
jgi:hypothetical protein